VITRRPPPAPQPQRPLGGHHEPHPPIPPHPPPGRHPGRTGHRAAAAATAAPAAFALPVPPVGGGDGTVAPPPPAQTVVTGGMPGWQIALIAVGAAILAAAVAVFLDRARAARRHQAAPSA
jgi:hypothetical protein